MKIHDIIKKPLVTEKGTMAQQMGNKYCFVVDRKATKHDVANAVHSIFKVKVESVRTMNMPSKTKRVGRGIGRIPEWKKAVVTLKEGDRIEFLEGA